VSVVGAQDQGRKRAGPRGTQKNGQERARAKQGGQGGRAAESTSVMFFPSKVGRLTVDG